MLAIAPWVLFAFAGLVAALVVADTLLKARAAHARLMREGAVLRAGLAVQASALTMPLRPAARSVTPARRPAAPRARPLPACAAA